MYLLKKPKTIFFLFLLFLCINLFSTHALANNPPDSGHSSLSASNQAPADGQSTINITVTLQDSSGNPLSGDNISLSDSSNSSAVFNPTSVTLNGSGQANISVTSTNAETDNISVTDNTSAVTLSNLGQITFVSTTATPTPGSSSSCTDSSPGSTPSITSAISNGTNQVTLTWTDASDPVSYYLLAFGTSSGQYIYGNPNIGGQGTTSYTVGSLSPGTKYYFVIRAGNGCATGGFSSEISATTDSVVANTTAPVDNSTDTNSQISQQDAIPTDSPTMPEDSPTPYLQATATPIPQRLIAGMSATKLTIYGILVVVLIGSVGSFMYWRVHKTQKKNSLSSLIAPTSQGPQQAENIKTP